MAGVFCGDSQALTGGFRPSLIWSKKSIPSWGVSAHHPIDRASRVRLDGKPMKTSAEYSQRYRIAKLITRDAAARDQLEILERSYFILSRSAQILLRSKTFRMRLSTPTTRHSLPPSRASTN
jgi:hypothetical protein